MNKWRVTFNMYNKNLTLRLKIVKSSHLRWKEKKIKNYCEWEARWCASVSSKLFSMVRDFMQLTFLITSCNSTKLHVDVRLGLYAATRTARRKRSSSESDNNITTWKWLKYKRAKYVYPILVWNSLLAIERGYGVQIDLLQASCIAKREQLKLAGDWN